MSWTQQLSGIRRVETRLGDTLQSIALRALGDAARWPELVQLNGLAPPYIVDQVADVVDRTLLAGQLIKVPAPGGASSAVADSSDIYGTDLDLSDGVLHATDAGDLQLISGAANLTQALEHRLETHRFELLYHPQYGNRMFELLGQQGDPVTLQLAAAYADRTLRADPRIATTQGTTATITGDAVMASTTAIATDGKALPVGGTD